MEFKDELENDLALAMLVEKRHSRRIGSKQARNLIDKIKEVLAPNDEQNAIDAPAQTLNDRFPFH